jgi:DNA polymerase III epsilon subunit-like protein
MKFLYVDCETNGLPSNYKAHFSSVSNWPHAVQITFQLKEDGMLIKHVNSIIKPRANMVWSEETAKKFHGISREIAERDGRDILEVLTELRECILIADVVIAHNMAFDKTILLAEAQRVYLEKRIDEQGDKWLWSSSTATLCTMESTTDIVKMPPFKNGKYKWPRLEELHNFLFQKNFDKPLHDSNNDVECLVKCHEELMSKK